MISTLIDTKIKVQQKVIKLVTYTTPSPPIIDIPLTAIYAVRGMVLKTKTDKYIKIKNN